MHFDNPVEIQEIADLTGAGIMGNDSDPATGINEIHKVTTGDITFVDHPKYYDRALKSAASVILINQKMAVPAGKTLLLTDAPFDAYNAIVSKYHPFKPALQPVGEEVELGEGTVVMPGAVIGNHVKIGAQCVIHPNVVIGDHCQLGDQVIIYANATIGADAFYYKKKATGYERLLSCGRVIIEDRVEIGAGSTIDRGVSGDTIIGEGTKIDNLVHVGHGTVIGKHCLIAAQTGIGGKAVIEDEVILWGQVGVNKDLTIGKKAVIYAQSGVAKSIEGGKTYFGSPVMEARDYMKKLAMDKQLASLWKKIVRSVK